MLRRYPTIRKFVKNPLTPLTGLVALAAYVAYSFEIERRNTQLVFDEINRIDELKKLKKELDTADSVALNMALRDSVDRAHSEYQHQQAEKRRPRNS